ncbi:MAG: OB-fold nucleic acid binding domain-containing protein [archaeon]
MQMSVGDIKAKIKAKTGLSDEELNKRMQEKLTTLAGLISEEGAAHIIANELGVKLFDPTNLKVKDVIIGMRSIDLAGRVIKKYEERTFNTAGREGKVANFLIGDETGSIRVVLWNKQVENFSLFNEGDIVKVIGGFVRANQDRPELHLNDTSKISINPSGVHITEIAQQAPATSKRKLVVQLTEQDFSVEILATIVQVFDMRFYDTCPRCNKKVQQAQCETHGSITPNTGYVLNCFLDDGSGNIRVVFFNEQVRQLLAMQDEPLKAMRLAPEAQDIIKKNLLGSIVQIRGKVNKNAMFDRLEIVAFSANPSPDPKQELSKLTTIEPLQSIPEEKTPETKVESKKQAIAADEPETYEEEVI